MNPCLKNPVLRACIAYKLILHKLNSRFGHIQVYNFESQRCNEVDHEQLKCQMDLFALTGGSHHGRDHMVDGFITTYAIDAYHH
jgi:hypothetical protein